MSNEVSERRGDQNISESEKEDAAGMNDWEGDRLGSSEGRMDTEILRAITRIDNTQESGSLPEQVHEPEDISEVLKELHDGDRLTAMRELLDEHNLRIVQQLLASETGSLSPKEVAFRNRGLISESTVRDHLRTLEKAGFVEKLEPDVERIPNHMPRTYYAASPMAIELLKQMGLWDSLGMLYQLYASLDRPEDIQRIKDWEHRPAPDWL